MTGNTRDRHPSPGAAAAPGEAGGDRREDQLAAK